jgi:hypothetical protein
MGHSGRKSGRRARHHKTALASALRETGIGGFQLHDLRHTWTTNARKAGVDRTVIMKLTGHKTLAMFTRYNSVDEEDARQALRMMDGFFAQAKSAGNYCRPTAGPKKGGWNGSQPPEIAGSPSRTRTYNLVVNSHPLCRLSYRGAEKSM